MTSQGVLDEVNRIRQERNIGEPLERLPCGKPGSVSCCPVANALGPHVLVDGESAWFAHVDELVRFPEWVVKWIEEFDDGEHPEYEA